MVHDGWCNEGVLQFIWQVEGVHLKRKVEMVCMFSGLTENAVSYTSSASAQALYVNLCLFFMFWTEGKERQRMNCCWTVLSVIPARSVEMSPLPGSAGEKHISTVCDYTVFSTFNLVCTHFIFVGCETLLSGVPRNAGRKDGYYA